jgi:hypothetical protein
VCNRKFIQVYKLVKRNQSILKNVTVRNDLNETLLISKNNIFRILPASCNTIESSCNTISHLGLLKTPLFSNNVENNCEEFKILLINLLLQYSILYNGVGEARARIFKRLWSPGIDCK